MGLVKALEVRKRLEEREKKRLEQRAEKLATREKRIEQRKVEVELLRELRRPVEDMELNGMLLKNSFFNLNNFLFLCKNKTKLYLILPWCLFQSLKGSFLNFHLFKILN